MGDFNYDILKMQKNQHIDDFINTMFSNFFQPCITEPTRVVDRDRPSLIDNIFSNVIDKKIVSGNILSKISDHMPNFLIILDFVHKSLNVRDKYEILKHLMKKLILKILHLLIFRILLLVII